MEPDPIRDAVHDVVQGHMFKPWTEDLRVTVSEQVQSALNSIGHKPDRLLVEFDYETGSIKMVIAFGNQIKAYDLVPSVPTVEPQGDAGADIPT